jgi:hypothetical protein
LNFFLIESSHKDDIGIKIVSNRDESMDEKSKDSDSDIEGALGGNTMDFY